MLYLLLVVTETF